MALERETPWGYLAIPPAIREHVDKGAPKLTWTILEQELRASCEDPLYAWLSLSSLTPSKGGEPVFDPFCAKQMFRYAFEGLPFFIKQTGVDNSMVCHEAVSTMIHYLYDCLKMVELPDSCSLCEGPPAPGIYAVINAAAARCRLDHYRLTGEEWALSIQEVALLARMRELSVRNAASPKSKTPITTTKSDEGVTVVDTSEADRWLNLRRRYVPTQLPESRNEIDAMVAAIEEWAI